MSRNDSTASYSGRHHAFTFAIYGLLCLFMASCSGTVDGGAGEGNGEGSGPLGEGCGECFILVDCNPDQILDHRELCQESIPCADTCAPDALYLPCTEGDEACACEPEPLACE